MRKQNIIIAIIILILLGVILVWSIKHESTPETQNTPPSSQGQEYEVKTAEVELKMPFANSSIASPLYIEGRAKGNWFFEASFPAKILDNDGMVLGSVPMQAKGEWMTPEFVEFSGQLIFTKPKGSSGTLLLENDNPSGLPENHKEIRVPIKFSSETSVKPSSVCAPGAVCELDSSINKTCLENNREVAC